MKIKCQKLVWDFELIMVWHLLLQFIDTRAQLIVSDPGLTGLFDDCEWAEISWTTGWNSVRIDNIKLVPETFMD